MTQFPVGSIVAVNAPYDGRKNTRFIGTVRKIEITEVFRYYVQFHPDMPWKEFKDDELILVTVSYHPPSALDIPEAPDLF